MGIRTRSFFLWHPFPLPGAARWLLIGWLGLTGSFAAQAQNVGIGTTTPHAAAALDVSATTKGFLPPRLTTAQRDAIGSPAAGLQVFNTSTGKLNVWNGSAWVEMLTTTEQFTSPPAAAGFSYTGAAQTYTVPPRVFSLSVEAVGAQGGGQFIDEGGKGARVQTTLAVVPGEVLTVMVGGAGTYPGGNGGFNGGGNGGVNDGGGGGASDIRRGAGGLADRLVVAGGGGGALGIFKGGAGGTPNGAAGQEQAGGGGQGGTQTRGGDSFPANATSNGALGRGGSWAPGVTAGGSGGGGGYYGGGAGAVVFTPVIRYGAGGGGSSWAIPTGSSGTVYSVAASGGDGVVVLTPGPQYATPALGGTNFVGVPAAALTGVVSTGNLPALTSTTSGTNRTVALGTGNSTTFSVGDDLGSHTATQNLNLGTNQLVGNGGSSGIAIASSGVVTTAGNLNLGTNQLVGNGGSSGIAIASSGVVTTAGNLNLGANQLVGNGGSNGLRIASGGNVGIGATTPDRPLTVQGTGTNSDLLSLKNNAGLTKWHLNLGGGGLNVAESGVADYRLFVAAGGNVGLGTATPAGRLDLGPGGNMLVDAGLTNAASRPAVGAARLAGEISGLGHFGGGPASLSADDGFLRLSAGGGSSAARAYIDLSGANTQPEMDNTLVFGTASAERLRINRNGNVGIGTNSPIARLHVSGGASAAPLAQAITYFEASNTALRLDNPSSTAPRNVVAYFEGGQFWVNGVIVAGALNTASDQRIKRVVGLSDRTADLALLNRLRITDYTYLDRVANTDKVVKKVIAQEVEEVLPAAVSRSRQAIPNVYEKAIRVTCANGYATLTTARPHELPATGGTLRLYTPDNRDLNVDVTVLDAHTVRFATAEDHRAGLFVYGKYVDDFRSVDYDALTTLNVSATQELARQVAAQQAQLDALQAANQLLRADHAVLQTLQAQVARLLAEASTATTIH